MMPKTHWKGSYGHDQAPVGYPATITGAEEAAGVDGRRGHDRQLRRAAVRHRALRLAVRTTASTTTASGRWRPTACWGIVFAPLLHANWDHLIANTVPALILGFLMTLAGMSRFIFATAIIWILGGFGTWLIGNVGAHCPYVGVRCETNHIGASGLIFGWLAFLIVFGFFTRKVWEIVVGVIVLFVYGSVLLGVLPGDPGGVVAGASVRRDRGRGRRVLAVRSRTQGARAT